MAELDRCPLAFLQGFLLVRLCGHYRGLLDLRLGVLGYEFGDQLVEVQFLNSLLFLLSCCVIPIDLQLLRDQYGAILQMILISAIVYPRRLHAGCLNKPTGLDIGHGVYKPRVEHPIR